MAETIPVSVQSLSQRLEILAAAEPSPFPVVSLYLDLSAVNNGHENSRRSYGKRLQDGRNACPPIHRNARASSRTTSAYIGAAGYAG